MKQLIVILLSLVTMTSMAQTTNQDSIHKSYSLNEVKVTAPSKTKIKDGNMLTRIVGTSVSTVGTADDVLSHVPGLMRMKGEIQVIGKGAPIYYINGRRVHDLTELQRLSSRDIKDVEVITAPGAQYDAQVDAVVRIRTLKQKGEGLGVTAFMKDEFGPSKSNNTLSTTANLNYRHDNIDVFGGITFDDNFLNHYDTEVTQESFGKVNNTQTGTTHMDQQYNTLKYNFGINYQLNDNNSLGFKIERNDNLKGITNFRMEEDILRNGILVDNLFSETHTDADGLNSWLANAYYSGQHGKLGIDWNADFYTTNEKNTANTIEISDAESRASEERAIKYVTSNSDARNKLFATKLVLSYPIGQGKLQGGTELTFTKRNNLYDITEENISNDKSSVKENTYALFAEYGTMIPKLGMLNLGVRYEHVDFKYNNDFNNALNLSRNNDYVLPFVSFSTEINEVQAVLSYTAKTRLPDYRILRSNIEYNNRFTLSTGDPTLKNELRHDINLSMRWRWLSMSTIYSVQKDGLYDWTYPYDENGTVLISWVNLNKPINRLSSYINASPSFGIWQLNYTAGIQKQWLTMNLNDPRTASGTREVKYNKPMYILIANNTFRVPTGKGSPLNIELNSEFLSSAHFGNAEIKNCFWDLSLAVQKSFLKNNALSVRLAFSDIFHTAHHDVTIDLGNYSLKQTNIYAQRRDVYDLQRISLSMSYKFNAVKSKYKGTGAGQDSRSRM